MLKLLRGQRPTAGKTAKEATIEFFQAIFGNSPIQIAKVALGKYIIAFACLLHIAWAIILCFDVRAVNATPMTIIYALCQHDRVLTIAVLTICAVLAGAFLDIRLRRQINISALCLFLIPQQILLVISALNGLYCTFIQKYADGTPMSWPHILVDQSPIIMVAALYTVALFEARHPPVYADFEHHVYADEKRETILRVRGPKGDKGDKGEQGPSGPPGKGA